MSKSPITIAESSDELLATATTLGLWGIVENWDTYRTKNWLAEYLRDEDAARKERSLQRRAKQANIGRVKPIADFDWSWPKSINRDLVEHLFTLEFIHKAENVVLLGNSGTGKTMIAKNLGCHAVTKGYRVLFTTAVNMLNDLAQQESGSALIRRVKKYTSPDVLIIDEVGYLASSAEYTSLMFEVITTRYEHRPIIITSNKNVTQWGEVFSGTSCTVAMVDRLMHRINTIFIDADSYRRKEAAEAAAQKAKKKKTSTRKKAR